MWHFRVYQWFYLGLFLRFFHNAVSSLSAFGLPKVNTPTKFGTFSFPHYIALFFQFSALLQLRSGQSRISGLPFYLNAIRILLKSGCYLFERIIGLLTKAPCSWHFLSTRRRRVKSDSSHPAYCCLRKAAAATAPARQRAKGRKGWVSAGGQSPLLYQRFDAFLLTMSQHADKGVILFDPKYFL